MKIAILIVVLVIGMTGMIFICRGRATDPVVDLGEKGLTLVIYSGGRPSKSLSVPPDCPLLAKMNSLLIEKRGKWKISFVSFAPIILLRGEKFSINCQRNRLIVNFENQPGQTLRLQVVTDLTPEEFSLIQTAAEEVSSGTIGK